MKVKTKLMTTKKTTTMKKLMMAKKTTKKKPLVIASGDSAFWVHQGPMLRSLLDLARFAEIMTEEQFAYHVKRNGNDFAKWVAGVIGDKVAAKAIALAKTSSALSTACRRTLLRYDV